MSERFVARRSRGGDLALPVAGVLLLLALACLGSGASRTPGVSMVLLYVIAVLLVAAGGVLLVWGIAYRRLAYALTESALRIDWLGKNLVVPYPAIQGIYTGQRLSGNSTPSMPGWPGIYVGPRRVRGLGRLRFYATSSDQSRLTFVTVEHGGVIISAQDPAAFQSALIEHVERYEDHALEPASEPPIWHFREPVTVPWTALADPWLPICVGLGLLVLLVVLGLIDTRYDSLPDQVALHFDASGSTSQIAPKSDLLRLPLLGVLCLVVDWTIGVVIHPRERPLARLLWLGGAIVPLVLLIGALRLVA